jgi:hypothetical protein
MVARERCIWGEGQDLIRVDVLFVKQVLLIFSCLSFAAHGGGGGNTKIQNRWIISAGLLNASHPSVYILSAGGSSVRARRS